VSARRILIAGASSRTICGVRDHGRILEATLDERGVEAITLWWEREEFGSPREALRECRAWLRSVREAIEASRPAWVIWAYSPFPFSHRGVPFLTPVVSRALARARVPVAAFLHELAYPFGRNGWRGDAWAFTQRAALRSVARDSAALIVTTEERLGWLQTRRWLSQRPVLFTPVFSNVPPTPEAHGRGGESELRVGVFGFGSENFRRHPVVSGLAALRAEGVEARLVLIGAPGATSAPATDWLRAADASGCREAVSFTGVLEPEGIARALRAMDVVVFPDELGPSARKGSLAASLSLGVPVVALDGPSRWDAAIAENALVLVDAEGARLADELRRLWRDTQARDALGERARNFYARRMAREVVTDRVLEFLDGVSPVRRPVSQGARA
jgi:glycosyltransferase involved in cell wall biosynthesis